MSQTDVYRKLFAERFKPETDKEIVYCSIILQLSESLEKQTRQNSETTKAVKYLAKLVGEMRGGVSTAEVEAEAAASPTTESEPERQQDNTPFPAGFSPAGPGGAAAGPTVETAPAASAAPAVEDEGGIPAPNASSGPAMNPQPIASKAAKNAQSKNGAKAEA